MEGDDPETQTVEDHVKIKQRWEIHSHTPGNTKDVSTPSGTGRDLEQIPSCRLGRNPLTHTCTSDFQVPELMED